MWKLLFNPFHRERKERDLDDELRFYVETLAEEKTRAGMPPDEALRAAKIQLGGIEQVKEQVRDIRPGAWVGTLLQEPAICGPRLMEQPRIRRGCRTLSRHWDRRQHCVVLRAQRRAAETVAVGASGATVRIK
jgi:hypothetical protein